MKKIALTVFVICLAAVGSFAQGAPPFSKYRVQAEKINSRQPDLASNKNARMYRTNLRNAAKEGVNFAGHYVVATWGCGTGCAESAIIDARTGKVFFPAVLQGTGAGFCDLPEDAETLAYKPDSRLLVLSGFKGGAQDQGNARCGIYYLEWTGANLRQIKYIPKKSSL